MDYIFRLSLSNFNPYF